jgi:hypothetical protein
MVPDSEQNTKDSTIAVNSIQRSKVKHMKRNENNKFQIAHNEMMKFCNNCQSKEKKECDRFEIICGKYKEQLYRIYYEDLYPFHACSECIMRELSRGEKDCGQYCANYWYRDHMRHIADCEIKGFAVYFSKDRTPFIAGPESLITDEYIRSDKRLKKIVNIYFTENIIAEVKRESFYPDVLNTVRQYREYCDDLIKTVSKISFKTEFF